VRQDIRDAKAAGLRSVPTFFLNGQRLSGAKPYKVFQKAFEEALKATGEPGP
jgi:predicted DsbA family dithiol-disulfide isomerase